MKKHTTTKEEWIKDTLKELHRQEDSYNKEIVKIDGQIKDLLFKKKKFANLVSKNMKHRNRIIKML